MPKPDGYAAMRECRKLNIKAIKLSKSYQRAAEYCAAIAASSPPPGLPVAAPTPVIPAAPSPPPGPPVPPFAPPLHACSPPKSPQPPPPRREDSQPSPRQEPARTSRKPWPSGPKESKLWRKQLAKAQEPVLRAERQARRARVREETRRHQRRAPLHPRAEEQAPREPRRAKRVVRSEDKPEPEFKAVEEPRRHTCAPPPTPPLPTALNPPSRGATHHFVKAYVHAVINEHTAAVAHLAKKMNHKARRRAPI